jgi:hypothetical protein
LAHVMPRDGARVRYQYGVRRTKKALVAARRRCVVVCPVVAADKWQHLLAQQQRTPLPQSFEAGVRAIKETDRRSPRTSLKTTETSLLSSSSSYNPSSPSSSRILHFPSYHHISPPLHRFPTAIPLPSPSISPNARHLSDVDETSLTPYIRPPGFPCLRLRSPPAFHNTPSEGYILAPVGLWSASAQQPSRY